MSVSKNICLHVYRYIYIYILISFKACVHMYIQTFTRMHTYSDTLHTLLHTHTDIISFALSEISSWPSEQPYANVYT